MMISLLNIVTKPLALHFDATVSARDEEKASTVVGNSSTEELKDNRQNHKQCHGFWDQVQGPLPEPVTFGSDKLWQNLINWRSFTRKNRSRIVVM